MLARQCMAVSGAADAVLRIPRPAAAALRVAIEERGISVVASREGTAVRAASPAQRFGLIGLLDEDPAASPVEVRIASLDPRGIVGEVCVSAELLPADADRRLAAERELAAAGVASAARQWQTAFRRYVAAARAFDALGLSTTAAAARHAAAELAYRWLYRERDAHALANAAAAGYGAGPDPALRGALVALRAKTMIELPGIDHSAPDSTARRLLGAARDLLAQSPHGAREIPRLTILEGFLEYWADNAAQSARLFQKAAARCGELGDWECYARARQNGALLAEEDQSFAAAAQAYADALAHLTEEFAPELMADIWDNLGRLQGTMGLLSRSEQSNLNALRLYARLGNCDGTRRSFARLGSLLVQIGSVDDAITYLRRAASLSCDELLAAADGGSTQLPIAAGLEAARVPPVPTADALCRAPIAAETLSGSGRLAVFNALLSLGEAALLEDDVAGASRCVELAEAYAGSSRTRLRHANAVGETLLGRGDFGGASRAFERALEIARLGEVPTTYEHVGATYLGLVRSALSAGRIDAARSRAREVLDMSVARGDVSQAIAALQLLAASLRETGELDLAVRTLRVAAALAERVPIDGLNGERRAIFLARQHAVFAELVDLVSSESYPGTPESRAWEAFQIAERGRARSLKYAAAQTVGDESPRENRSIPERFRDLLGRLSRLSWDGLESSDTAELPEVLAADDADPIPATDPEALIRTLDRLDATLIEYAVGRTEMYAFVVEGGRVWSTRLGDRRAIARAAGELYERLRDPEATPNAVEAASRRLAELVIWPLRAHVTRKRIVFVPEDALHTVPFTVLPWTPEPGGPLVVHLAETTLVPTALSLVLHANAAARPVAAPRLALIGDPVFRLADWRRECEADVRSAGSGVAAFRAASSWAEWLPRLPGTRDEVLGIGDLARRARPASRIEMRIGCAATPRAFLRVVAADPDVLHVATHGHIDSRRPRLSALALTPEPGAAEETATIDLLDILGLELRSRLVVLSACDTSRGRLLPGEGVLGPAQAFLQAGAASVLASYWRVEDRRTGEFIQRFYRYLLAERLPAAAALRRAQLDAARDGAAFHWAAFGLYGWPDTAI